jgi:Cu(I)/Ag(I) efflux system membrane fusion protein
MKNQDKNQLSSFQTSFFALLCTMVAVVGLSRTVARADSVARATGTQRFDQQMQPILESYLQIANALSANSLDGVRDKAQAIAKHAKALDAAGVSGEHLAHYKNVPANLEKAAQALSKAEGIDKARESFKKLSQPMAMWATMSKPKGIDVLYCSMAKGSWVQKHGKLRNPYYGPKMLDCGEVVGGDSHESHKH